MQVKLFQAFNKKLKARTSKTTSRAGWSTETFDKLKFVPLAKYDQVPPTEVLDKLETAQERECFDSYEVCKVESVRKVEDPIIFGIVKGCPDKFYIAQWDDDVKIEEILGKDQG